MIRSCHDVILYSFSLPYLVAQLVHSEKSLARSMLFYSRNCQKQSWAQFVLYINSDCMYFWLQLWHKNHCKNTGYYSIFQLSLLLLLITTNITVIILFLFWVYVVELFSIIWTCSCMVISEFSTAHKVK